MHVPDPLLVAKALAYCRIDAIRREWGGDLLRQLVWPPERSRGPTTPSIRGFVETESLFVHVPKAAGISLLQALYGNIGLAHTSIAEYRRLFRPRFFRRAFVFTFVRNPWDRIYSAYNFLAAGGWSGGDAALRDHWLVHCRDFEQFVLEVLPLAEARSIPHFWPQVDLLRDADGTLFGFDFVGRYETLADDFETVRRRVNPAARLAHLNRTPGSGSPDYRAVYAPEMRQRIAEL